MQGQGEGLSMSRTCCVVESGSEEEEQKRRGQVVKTREGERVTTATKTWQSASNSSTPRTHSLLEFIDVGLEFADAIPELFLTGKASS